MSAIKYRPDIQGMRAIAVLTVMAFHFNSDWLPGGFIGVDVFLVISGFLITGILLKKKAAPDYTLPKTLRYFYISRFKRIAPVYFVVLTVVGLAAAVFFTQSDFDTFKDGFNEALWFNSNNFFADFGNYFAPANHEQPLLHTWSLAVEIQFYLLAPFLILLLPVKLLKWVLAILLLALTAVAEYRLRRLGIEQATYYSLYARLPEFFAGCLAALYVYTAGAVRIQKRWFTGLGLSLILISAAIQPALGTFPGIGAVLPVLGSVLVLINTGDGGASRLLTSKWLVWVGALSYSLYLWHWPVLAFLRYYNGAEILDLSFSLLFIILTLSLSVVSYYCLEQPMRGIRKVRLQRLGYAAVGLVAIGSSQSLAEVNKVFSPEQLPVAYTRYADLDTICHGKMVGDCFRGDLSSKREILVLGDSHAAMLNLFFDYLGKQLGFKARIITASSCVTIPGFDRERIAEWARQPCEEQIQNASRYLDEVGTIILAGSWSGQTKSDAFMEALNRFLQQRSGQKVYLLSQVPRFSDNVVRMRRAESLGFDFDIHRNFAYQEANKKIEVMASRYPYVQYVSLDELKVFENAPRYKGQFIYRDHHHLNEVGAKLYAVEALNNLKPILGAERSFEKDLDAL